jgi:tRNA threonylcarbamoyl adenosine modification protein YeaZ
VLVLVVDSSTPAVTAALAEVTADGTAGQVRVLAQRRTVDARAHGELLAPQVAAVLTEAGARPRDLGAIVAGLGPGPFTGLRVGLVTAATMAQALGVPAYGVCSLDAMGRAAATAPAPVPGGGRVLVATDARRREIYWAAYEQGRPLTGPGVESPAVVAVRAAELGLAAAVGEGALRYAETLGLPVRDEPRFPPPAALAELAAERVLSGAPAGPLTPLYLRRPDAVEPGGRKAVLQR